jgi:hypothetical protein
MPDGRPLRQVGLSDNARELSHLDRKRRAVTSQPADELSFRRIVSVPFGACLAALDRWQLTGHDGELRLGGGLLAGPVERDQHSGTRRLEVRLARGPLRPPVQMRLDIDHWSASHTALELTPGQRVRPSAAYFAAGHRLLDSLTRALRAPGPAQPRLGMASRLLPELARADLNGGLCYRE